VSGVRVTSLIAAAGLGAALLGVVGGYYWAWSDGRGDAASRRAALQSAVSDYRAMFGRGTEVDPRFIRMVERSIGFIDLKFEQQPPASAREMQPVTNADGRIVGFFTWDTASADRVEPWLGGVGFALIAFASLALRRYRRSALSETGDAPIADAGKSQPTEKQQALESEELSFIRDGLPRALQAQLLDVHYQPIVAAAGGKITGVEALLRWTDQERGAISPVKFIPVAEQMGLMDELGAFVLRRAVHDAKSWPDVYVSVNLSPLQVRDRKIVDVVRSALTESNLAPSRLILEITEGVLIDNPEEMLKRIEELRALGVRIALDDFGSGYSSLGYLQRFAFDKLKIDRSFVTPLGRSQNAAVIIQAIVALGRALDVTVVVEGVETEEQRVLLRLAGCDEMQGFLFARPASVEAITPLVASAKAASAAA
jgi:EAL domain-containing protein (putative c-di-GMP-specific phosphodiesterase class I)